MSTTGMVMDFQNFAINIPAIAAEANVSTPSPEYTDMAQRWHLIDALLGGTEAMRKHRQMYLPQNEAEAPTSYLRRLNRTFLYEGFSLSVETLVGKPFSEDVQLSDAVDSEIRAYMNDVDKQGNDITTFARELAIVGIAKGLVHVLVDYNRVQGTISLQQKAENNIRPYMVKIDPERVIGWQYTMEGNVPVLSQVRIAERFRKPLAPWGETFVNRVRVFDRLSDGATSMVTFRVFEEQQIATIKGGTEWVVVDSGECSTKYIPLVTFYFGRRKGFMHTRPPLMGLAWLNMEHWQSSSEQRNILNVARCPVWFMSGYQPATDDDGNEKDGVVIGPDSMIRTSAADADMKIVEHTGKAIGAGRTDLQDIEARMAHSGAEILFKGQKAQTSATESGHDNSSEDCKLATMIKLEEDGLGTVLCIMHEYEGKSAPAGKLVTINTDFGLEPQDAADLQVLYQSRMAGQIDQPTYLKELKRRGVLAPDVDLDKACKDAAAAGPVIMPTAPVPPNNESSTMNAGPKGLNTKAGAGA